MQRTDAPRRATITPRMSVVPSLVWDDQPARLPIPGPRRPVGHTGDSDPDMDEALRRVQTNLAYIERDQQPINEYYAWAASAAA